MSHNPMGLHSLLQGQLQSGLRCVGIAIMLRAGRPRSRGSILGTGMRFSLFSTAPRPVVGPTQPPILRVTGSVTLGLKRRGEGVEADYLHPFSIEFKNGGAIPQFPHASSLMNPKDSFTLYLLLHTLSCISRTLQLS
jgi:hypothetical protein